MMKTSYKAKTLISGKGQARLNSVKLQKKITLFLEAQKSKLRIKWKNNTGTNDQKVTFEADF